VSVLTKKKRVHEGEHRVATARCASEGQQERNSRENTFWGICSSILCTVVHRDPVDNWTWKISKEVILALEAGQS
jgi:hypothetical protein